MGPPTPPQRTCQNILRDRPSLNYDVVNWSYLFHIRLDLRSIAIVNRIYQFGCVSLQLQLDLSSRVRGVYRLSSYAQRYVGAKPKERN